MQETEILIIGGGIVALTLARELLARGAEDIVILEKESSLAQHASGRNSGVMHAGIYYAAETLKAKFCIQGNRLMKQYCQEQGLPLSECGKVIVTRTEKELPMLQTLFERANANGAKVRLIDPQELAEREPMAKTVGQALWSDETAVVDPKAIMQRLSEELLASGKVKIELNTAFIAKAGKQSVRTNQGFWGYKHLINAAGSYADKVAHQFGVAKHLVSLPFKGLYKKLDPKHAGEIHGNIYPVPDIRNPFLGVHFTRSIHGDVYVGPTAIPALGRENYGLLSGIDLEAVPIMYRELILFLRNSKFRRVALQEPKKYCAKAFYKDARKLVKQLEPSWLQSAAKVGLRPQLVDWRTKELVMDFLVEKHDADIHVLNAISPAFTCSMAFAKFVVDEYCQEWL